MMLMAQPVCAQAQEQEQTGRPARPFRSLFGSTGTSRPSLHALDLTVSLNGATDNGLAAPAPEGSFQQSGFQQLYSAAALLSYTMSGRRFSVDARGSANVPRYTGSPDQLSTLGYSGNAALSFTSGATSARAFGSYTYSPYYYVEALGPTAALGPSPPPFDYASERSPNDQTAAGASFTRRFGRRTSASLTYDFNGTWFENDDRSNRSQDVRISADRQLSRRLTVRGSYAYRNGEYVTAATPTTNTAHDIDLGVGYNRTLPRGQAATIDLSLGSSNVNDGLTRRLIWRGSALASRTLSGGWSVGAGISRTLQFDNVVQQPVVADVANADVSGRFGRRVTLSFAGTYSNGQGQAEGSQRFSIYSGSARAQFGLASFAAIDVQYTYYHYDFPPGYQLPEGVPVRMNRQRLQIGASFWLPLVRAGGAGTSPSSVIQ